MIIHDTTTKTYGSFPSHNLEPEFLSKIQSYDDDFYSHSVHQCSLSASSSNQSTDTTALTSTFFAYDASKIKSDPRTTVLTLAAGSFKPLPTNWVFHLRHKLQSTPNKRRQRICVTTALSVRLSDVTQLCV